MTDKADPKKPSFLRSYGLIILAAVLLWIGGRYDQTPKIANHQILIASPAASAKSGQFAKAVLFMEHHNAQGALGFIINRPSKDGHYYVGGPMSSKEVFALHTLDVKIPETIEIADTHLGVVEGQAAVDKLRKMKPKWSIVLKGYTGWGKRQLESEIKDGNWEVVEFDDSLLEKTKPADMWDKATKMPMIQQTH